MADAVRQEHELRRVATACAGLQRMMSASRSTSAGQLVRLQVHVAPVDPGTHRRAQCLLHPVHALDQGGEVAVAGGVGARDVAGVAGELAPGIDQQRVA